MLLPRPRVVWPTLFGALAGLNLWCNLGEANGDTISENLRDIVRAVPHGEELLAGGLAAAGVGIWKHICKAAA